MISSVEPKRLAEDAPIGKAWFVASPELVAQMFGFPAGTAVKRIEHPFDRSEIKILVEGPGLPLCPEGSVVERITPIYSCYTVRAGEVAEQDARHVEMTSW